MDWKEIVAILVLIFVGIPLIIKVVAFSIDIGNPKDTAEESTQLITEAVTPWWLNLVQKLLEFGTPGAIVVVALLMVLKEAGVL
jgi:hypothetical protein